MSMPVVSVKIRSVTGLQFDGTEEQAGKKTSGRVFRTREETEKVRLVKNNELSTSY